MRPGTKIPARKDEDAAHQVATAWREALRGIVRALCRGDFALVRRPEMVEPVKPTVANQMREYVLDYGETLVDLPDDTWTTSVSQWMGDHWHVLVNLWTQETGESDLVVSVRVFEAGEGFRIEVDSVHVP